MNALQLSAAKRVIQGQLRELLAGKSEVGLSDVKRDLARTLRNPDAKKLAESGLFVAKMLNAIGWARNGWMYTGYDRTQRYLPQEPAR